MIRIKSVHPIPPATLYVEWADGLQGPIDLAEWIVTGSGLIAPLKDAAVFATARVGEHGASVEWGEGGDLAIDAAHLMLKMHVARRSPTRRPTHPGAILREDVLPALGLSPEQAAEAMGMDVEVVRWILDEKASVTPEAAEAIGTLAGNGPNLWLRMQEAYDRYHPTIMEAVQESLDDLREVGILKEE